VAHVGQDFPLFRGDACGGVEAGVLHLGNKRTGDKNASGVAGVGVVNTVVVVGERGRGSSGHLRWSGRGRRRLIGRVATYPTLGIFSDCRDVRLRSLADVGGGPWWRGWGRPARMQGRRWRGGSCRLRTCSSIAGIPPPPRAHWPVWEWLRGRGQAQWGTGEPGSRRRERCRWRANCMGTHRGDADELGGERHSRGKRR
jgi:hypothetical protein